MGGEPEEDWAEIGARIVRHLKAEVAKCADAEPDDDWDTIGHKMEGKIRAETATGLGGEPDESPVLSEVKGWDQIGNRLLEGGKKEYGKK